MDGPTTAEATGPAPEWYVKKWLAEIGAKRGKARSRKKLKAVRRNARDARAAKATKKRTGGK